LFPAFERLVREAAKDPPKTDRASEETSMMNQAREQKAVEMTQVQRPAPQATDLNVQSLSAGDIVRLRTRNTEYRIRVTDPRSSQVVVDGGSVFKEPSTVEVIGACDGLGVPLGAGRISVGHGLLLLHCGSWVRMSTVRSVSVERCDTPAHRRAAVSLP
jgi:hypothetical protein